MSKNKPNNSIGSRQEVTYIELNFSRSQQKQKLPKTDQSQVLSSEEQLTYVELKCHKSSHLQLKGKIKDPQFSALQVVTGSLGILCVILMTTLGCLLANLFSSKGEQNRKTSFIPNLSIASDGWIGFGNSCYHFFKESKTWPESYAACGELNSRLLKMDSKGKLKILNLLGIEGWIDFQINKTVKSLLWEDGTQVNQSLLRSGMKNHTCARVRGMYIYFDNCSSGESYVCEL